MPALALSPEEFASLRELAQGLDHRAIPPKHADRLRKLGLIAVQLGKDQITAAGRSRLASGM
jgi:hypothetical protein